VLWIFMENKAFTDVIGQPKEAPYENALAQSCGLARNYHGIGHPSLPNYIGATSGNTWGISDDVDPGQHPLAVPSIYSQLDKAGLSWREYAEDKPAGCPQTNAGRYAVRHDPVTYYTRARAECARRDVPLSRLTTDLAENSLPSFAFVSPNLCNDTHDCPVATGDRWLSSWLGRILASPTFHAGATAVFLTWDEGRGDNQVPLVVIAPSVPRGASSSQASNHYSLLKTTEALLGLPLLGHARDHSTASFVKAFHLLPH
jgi:phosphatidylinositol-3-phosphatase